MTNPSQLFLLADHIKLSLLERQRAVSLDLEPNSQDGEISRSLESLQEGISQIDPQDEAADQLHQQYHDLSMQFHQQTPAAGANAETGTAQDPDTETPPIKTTSSPDLKQPIPQHPPSKSVRFMDSSPTNEDADADPNRDTLFHPYRDSPSPAEMSQDHHQQSGMSNQQIHAHHSSVMRDQDDQLDRLGESIGRQHQLSIQIGDELEGHVALLDGMDGDVDRHQTRMDRAKKRLDRIRRTAGDNLSLMTIIGLIIILVILIVILK